MKHYDYIICGGGMSGLSLAYYLNKSKLCDKSILIIEPEEKTKNDRTWAFWENKTNTFENILLRKWDSVRFTNAEGQSKVLDIGNYQYKLLRGIDFYTFVIDELKKNPKIEWLKEKAISIEDTDNQSIVKTENSIYSTDYVFDSIYKLNLKIRKNHNLLQHFKGLVIQTKIDFFTPEMPDMMNFGIEQKNAECRFIYILPFDSKTALVEYTLFSENLLSEKEYDEELKEYIKNDLKLSDYQILEEEFGVIPMSDENTNEFPSKHIVRIGTAGGYTNPATGYTFQNTQRRLLRIVESLEKTGKPYIKDSFFKKRFLLYSSVLLNVLEKKRHLAADVFDRMYAQNPPSRVFRFLDGDTNFIEELKIMWSTPKHKFMVALLDVIRRKYLP